MGGFLSLLHKTPDTILFKWLLWLWPPYFGANVKVTHVAPDLQDLKVEMGLHFWNQNYVGTQFGGSLYSMVDPWYMLLLLRKLGKEYVVWDKQATIRYVRPGKGRVYADFKLSDEEIEKIRAETDEKGKTEPRFTVDIVDGKGTVIAQVEKILHVRRKDRRRPEPAEREFVKQPEETRQ